jgi:hypothetical protein
VGRFGDNPRQPIPGTLFADSPMDLKLPITIIDELSEDEVRSQGELDLASGEIRNVRYEDDYDSAAQGVPATRKDYEFTVGVLRNGAREVEFRVEVDAVGGRYSVTPSELLELKGRAAKLFSQRPPNLH